MRLLGLVVVMCLLAGLWVLFKKPPAIERTVAETPTPAPVHGVDSARADVVREAAAHQGQRVERVICPVCNGKGMVPSASGSISAQQSCNVCFGRGYRDITIPVGYVVCPDCHGMTKLAGAKQASGLNTMVAIQTCKTCLGRGVILASKSVAPH